MEKARTRVGTVVQWLGHGQKLEGHSRIQVLLSIVGLKLVALEEEVLANVAIKRKVMAVPGTRPLSKAHVRL